MARMSPLPPRLRYLEPVRKYLAKLGPGGINEDVDLAPIRKVVRQRVRGLSDAEAGKVLTEDGVELGEWLSGPERQNEPLHFLSPFLAIGASDALLRESAVEPPEHEIYLETPEGAKVSKEHGCWSVTWRGMLASFYPSDIGTIESETARFRDEAKRRPMQDGDGIEVTDVQFGSARGFKRIYREVWPVPGKRVDYALEVSGGFVIADLQSARGRPDFEESKLEAQFHTLRVISHK